MNQPLLFNTTTHLTVTELTRYIRQVLDADPILQDIWIQGEMSNLSRPSSGHIYFTLKDPGASLRCVMWKSDAARLRLKLQDGLAVEAHGYISVYEPGGQYQLYVDLLQPVGEGALYQEFLRIKAKLEAEGLFDLDRKRPVPQWPKKIGVVTSPTGAAVRDILNTIQRRFPLAEVLVAPTPVQGDDAPPKIIAALENLNRLGKPDVILLARGGGSIEDLWAFNDELVVRAIVASEAPVITGVGHETDFTLADFAADLRAPTPTAAAEFATPITISDLRFSVEQSWIQMSESIYVQIETRFENVNYYRDRTDIFSPLRRIQMNRQHLDELSRIREKSILYSFALAGERLSGYERRLDALNPAAILSRGFAIVTSSDDKVIIRSKKQVKEGDSLRVRVSDGDFGTRVENFDQRNAEHE